MNLSTVSGSSTPPPAPWQDWDQVRQVREALREHRFLLMRRPEHLSAEQQALVADLLASPPAEVNTARTFLLDWYAVWKDDQGHRRSVADARALYEAWRSNPVYLAVPALRRALARMTDARFEHLSPFSATAALGSDKQRSRARGTRLPAPSGTAFQPAQPRGHHWCIGCHTLLAQGSSDESRTAGGKSLDSRPEAKNLGRSEAMIAVAWTRQTSITQSHSRWYSIARLLTRQ